MGLAPKETELEMLRNQLTPVVMTIDILESFIRANYFVLNEIPGFDKVNKAVKRASEAKGTALNTLRNMQNR